MNPKVESCSFHRLTIEGRFVDVFIDVQVRLGDEEGLPQKYNQSTINLRVRLPMQDYTLTEVREAAMAKAKVIVAAMLNQDVVVTAGSTPLPVPH